MDGRHKATFSRRDALRHALAGGALGVGFGAGWLSRAVGTASAQRAISGTLQVAWDQVQDNLDPQTARGNRNWWVLTELYDTLTYLPGYSLDAKPYLAESWTVSGNGTVYTFKLRRGVKFTTGSELTAEAVKYSSSIGAPHLRVLLQHVLPNAFSPVVVQATLDLGAIILTTAALSFIGFGAEPGTPDWGRMVADGRQYMRDHWWVVLFPAIAIFFAVAAFNLAGDGARDAFDPRLRGES